MKTAMIFVCFFVALSISGCEIDDCEIGEILCEGRDFYVCGQSESGAWGNSWVQEGECRCGTLCVEDFDALTFECVKITNEEDKEDSSL